MSWVQLKDALIPKPGRLRSEALYSALVDRAQHLVTDYTPCIGGLSPGSFIDVAGSTTTTYAHPLVTPSSGTCSFTFVANVTGSGVGVVTFLTSAGSGTVAIPASATTFAQYTITGVPLSGSVDRTTITVQNTDSGGTVVVYGGVITATSAAGAELDELPPDSEVLEAGQPLTADCVRRLGDSMVYIARKRPPALSYFSWFDGRDDSEASTAGFLQNTGYWFHKASHGFNGLERKIAFTAPTTTYCTSYHMGWTTTQGAGVGTIAVHTLPFFGDGFVFTDNAVGPLGDPAPIQSYVIYEVVP